MSQKSGKQAESASSQHRSNRWAALGEVHPGLLFAAIFAVTFVLHLPLLTLPYFWDEAGYYVPAARDILLTGTLIPHSTLSNAHPPLVLAWLAAWWKVIGYAPVVTRSAMLLLAAFSLMGVYRLADAVACRRVAVAATACTAFYPVFFAQSTLAQIDLPAAGFVFWGLAAYVQKRNFAAVSWFALASLAKETAVLVPVAIAIWELIGLVARRSSLRTFWRYDEIQATKDRGRRVAWLLVSLAPLIVWYAYHYSRTGYVFGNPEFFRYNVAETLDFHRFVLALILRLWQVVGYLHLWVLTLFALFANNSLERSRDSGKPPIRIPERMMLYFVLMSYVVAMALIGGAVLARYMLPVVPLVIIFSISALSGRVRHWEVLVLIAASAFVAAWFWNPPYGFSPEDNLAYRDYVILHEDAERFLEARYPMAQVLTAWPASDEITHPWLGYISRPMRVARINDFSLKEMSLATERLANYDCALIFSTKFEPVTALWEGWPALTTLREAWKTRYFGYHRDMTREAAAQLLGGRIVFSEQRNGQWIAVITMEHAELAQIAEKH